MKINPKKILSKVLVGLLLVGMTSTSVFAQGMTPERITDKAIQNANMRISNQEDALVDYLKNNLDEQDLNKTVEQFFSQQELKNNSIPYSDIKIVQDNNKSKNIKTNIERVVNLKKNNSIIFFNNGTFSIDRLITTKSTPVLNGLSQNSNILLSDPIGTVWGQAYKDFYSWCGKYVFTVAVGCRFYYTFGTATYYGGLIGYYKRGTLTTWQVQNWTYTHEQQGDNHCCYCSGNFNTGIEINGVGLVLQDFYIYQSAVCDPYGNITEDYQIY